MTGLFAHRTHNQGRAFAAYRRQQSRDTLDRFADRLAEHGDVAKAAAQIGKSTSYGRTLLQRIIKRLGWQAS